MPSRQNAQRTRLAVSGRATLLIIDGGYNHTVSQLSEKLGIPERTFYNYFPTKADVIRPVLEHGIDRMASTIIAEPLSSPFAAVLMSGFESSLWGEHGEHTKRVVPVVLAEPALYAVWLSTIQSFETTLAAAIRPRVDVVRDSVEEHMLAATLVSAVRISFEHMATHRTEPVATFWEALGSIVIPATLHGDHRD
jgi:AcrR family transcriptional regulator